MEPSRFEMTVPNVCSYGTHLLSIRKRMVLDSLQSKYDTKTEAVKKGTSFIVLKSR